MCVLDDGKAGWRGHFCCQSIVTLDSPKYHSIIQEGIQSSTKGQTNQTVDDVSTLMSLLWKQTPQKYAAKTILLGVKKHLMESHQLVY